uniref:Strictosidine synthase 3 n=1 Tax=Camptotheca acuminata TaxID=16922 RepID=A0A8F2YIV8_CAMAC|nr:strictosidine synthase 3 [Camptotheca acuminata]
MAILKSSRTSAMLFIFISYFSCSSVLLVTASFQALPSPAPGPASFTFDLPLGIGALYTGLADGRIVRYQRLRSTFFNYGYTAPNRNQAFCDGTNNTFLAPICGRPLGLAFQFGTRRLYAADAAFGLVVIVPFGGPATQLATGVDGVRFRYPAAVDVDQFSGTVYFTDASIRFNLSQLSQLIRTRDTTGRLLKYDPNTRQVTVLLRGLAGPFAVAISSDRTYVLISEFNRNRIQKYWLTGPNANTAEVLLSVAGSPGNIRRTIRGDFWVAINVQTPTVVLRGQRINGDGTILQTETFSPDFNTTLITEVNEYGGALYLGSLFPNFVGVYKP